MSLWQDVQRRGQASPLLQRWQQLADRDRQALRLLGLALLLALLYVMLWQPVQLVLASVCPAVLEGWGRA